MSLTLEVINVTKQPCHQMSPKTLDWLTQVLYWVYSLCLYNNLRIANNCFTIFIFRRLQFNALSHYSQSFNSPYKKTLLGIFWGFILHHWSQEKLSLCWLLLRSSFLNCKFLLLDIYREVYFNTERWRIEEPVVPRVRQLINLRAFYSKKITNKMH
jgi:hypothetical protein